MSKKLLRKRSESTVESTQLYKYVPNPADVRLMEIRITDCVRTLKTSFPEQTFPQLFIPYIKKSLPIPEYINRDIAEVPFNANTDIYVLSLWKKLGLFGKLNVTFSPVMINSIYNNYLDNLLLLMKRDNIHVSDLYQGHVKKHILMQVKVLAHLLDVAVRELYNDGDQRVVSGPPLSGMHEAVSPGVERFCMQSYFTEDVSLSPSFYFSMELNSMLKIPPVNNESVKQALLSAPVKFNGGIGFKLPNLWDIKKRDVFKPVGHFFATSDVDFTVTEPTYKILSDAFEKRYPEQIFVEKDLYKERFTELRKKYFFDFNLYYEDKDSVQTLGSKAYLYTHLIDEIKELHRYNYIYDSNNVCSLLGISEETLSIICRHENLRFESKLSAEDFMTLHFTYMESYHRLLSGEDPITVYAFLREKLPPLFRVASPTFYKWLTPIPDETNLILNRGTVFAPGHSYPEDTQINTGHVVWLHRAKLYLDRWRRAVGEKVSCKNLIYTFPAFRYGNNPSQAAIRLFQAYYRKVPVKFPKSERSVPDPHFTTGDDGTLYWKHKNIRRLVFNDSQLDKLGEKAVVKRTERNEADTILLTLFTQFEPFMYAPFVTVPSVPVPEKIYLAEDAETTRRWVRDQIDSLQKSMDALHNVKYLDVAAGAAYIQHIHKVNTLADVVNALKKIDTNPVHPVYAVENKLTKTSPETGSSIYVSRSLLSQIYTSGIEIPPTDVEQMWGTDTLGLYHNTIDKVAMGGLYFGQALLERQRSGDRWGSWYMAVLNTSVFPDIIRMCHRRGVNQSLKNIVIRQEIDYSPLTYEEKREVGAEKFQDIMLSRALRNDLGKGRLTYLKTPLFLPSDLGDDSVEEETAHIVLVRAVSPAHALVGLCSQISHFNLISLDRSDTTFYRKVMERIRGEEDHTLLELNNQCISLRNLCSTQAEYERFRGESLRLDNHLHTYRNNMVYSDNLAPAEAIIEFIYDEMDRLTVRAAKPDLIMSPFINTEGVFYPS